MSKSKTIFHRLCDYAEYAESRTHLDGLQKERAELRQRVANLLAEIGDDKPDDVKAQAAALVAGETAEEFAHADSRMMLGLSEDTLEVVEAAVEMQSAATKKIARKYQKSIAEERTAAHKEHAVKLDNILSALVDEMDAERQFVADLVADGGDPILLPMSISRPFNLGTRNKKGWSQIEDWRANCRRFGYLK